MTLSFNYGLDYHYGVNAYYYSGYSYAHQGIHNHGLFYTNRPIVNYANYGLRRYGYRPSSIHYYRRHGLLRGFCSTRRSLRYGLGLHSYTFCRPVYYSYNVWSDTYYGRDGYYYNTPRSYVVEEEPSQGDYDEGYRDGYYEGAINESGFGGDKRQRLVRTPDKRDIPVFARATTKLTTQASAAYQEGDYERSTKLYKDASIGSPTSSKLKRELGQSAFAASRYDLAAFAMRRAFALDAKVFESSANPRIGFEDEEVYNHQVELLQTAIAKTPNQANLHFLLGTQKLLTGDKAAARAAFSKALALDANDRVTAKLLATMPKE